MTQVNSPARGSDKRNGKPEDVGRRGDGAEPAIGNDRRMTDINDGPAVSGSALLIGLADIVIMTEDAYAFVSSPNGVRQFTGVNVSIEELGGSAVHDRSTGVAHAVVPDRAAAEALVSGG